MQQECEPGAQNELKQFKLISARGNNALPHTDLFTIMTAAGLSHRKVSIHKNVQIEDTSGHLPETIAGSLMSVEISPRKPDKPELSGILSGSFIENREYGTLVFHISKDRESNAPFYMNLNIFHKSLIDVNIKAKIANGKTADFLALQGYLKKMKNKDYRRFKILNSDGEQVLTSSCPNMHYDFTSLELESISQINKLEQISGTTIGIPYYYNENFLTILNRIIEKWEDLTGEQRQKKLHDLIRLHGIVKLTAYKVILKGEDDEVLNVSFSEESGWIDYHSLGFSSNSGSMKVRWRQIAKDHGPITLSIRNRAYGAAQLYYALNNRITDKIFLQSLANLLNQPVTERSAYKSHITINFKAPVKYGWYNVQHIDIEIKDVDPSINELEVLLLADDYVTAIPLLENYKDAFLENLAYAYALNGQFDESILCANEAIGMDHRSVAHFTKGLAYVGKGDFHSAYNAYLLAVHVCTAEWYPIAKENLERLIRDNDIQTNVVSDKIHKILDDPRPPMNDNEKCYCRSGRKFKNCHGKHTK
ncbi:SEC-C metal-binding domain-containing protein [Cytobacillus firmus]|uniref:SEC-C metal-binding domain-containing protein n=1 Tax=Cytobacillus firmus TaxID=1399 RepID=UPI0022285109|nr:SEC-C metal-binding domain-containing protein [Cytobacillus firmus]